MPTSNPSHPFRLRTPPKRDQFITHTTYEEKVHCAPHLRDISSLRTQLTRDQFAATHTTYDG